MSDRYIEKTFLWLVIVSALVHLAVFAAIYYFPQEKKAVQPQPYMVELQDLPLPKGKPAEEQKEVKRIGPERHRVPREMAPRGEMTRELPSAVPSRPAPAPRSAPNRPAPAAPSMEQKSTGGGAIPTERGMPSPLSEKPSGGDFFRRRERGAPNVASLYPTTQKLARLEEGYRKKYEREVEEGDAKFLNTDDIQFGSFLRRFESAVYGVWRYPEAAVRMGLEGVVPTRITFNRNGEIEKVEILEGGSGSKILDDEVRRAMKLIGPIGHFPKAYDKDTFKLLAFFQYGIVRGVTRLQ